MASCLDYALHYLNRYPKTHKEMVLQLRKKWYTEEDIVPTMRELETKKYINDRQFVDLYLNSEVIKKWKPMFSVKWKLLQKWVDKHLIEEVAHEYEKDINDGMIQKIIKEVDKLTEKWLDWIVIVQKLQMKWYSVKIIRQALEVRKNNE